MLRVAGSWMKRRSAVSGLRARGDGAVPRTLWRAGGLEMSLNAGTHSGCVRTGKGDLLAAPFAIAPMRELPVSGATRR